MHSASTCVPQEPPPTTTHTHPHHHPHTCCQLTCHCCCLCGAQHTSVGLQQAAGPVGGQLQLPEAAVDLRAREQGGWHTYSSTGCLSMNTRHTQHKQQQKVHQAELSKD